MIQLDIYALAPKDETRLRLNANGWVRGKKTDNKKK
jgi:hypothetical protein